MCVCVRIKQYHTSINVKHAILYWYRYIIALRLSLAFEKNIYIQTVAIRTRKYDILYNIMIYCIKTIIIMREVYRRISQSIPSSR